MKPASLLLPLAMLAACDSPSSPAAAGAQAGDFAPAAAISPDIVHRLPLELGFFVASDVACGDASNATLLLHDGEGINSSREVCAFTRIERTGDDTYSATQACTTIGGGGDDQPNEVVYTIESPKAYAADNRTYDWQYSARYCPRDALPEPWRSNDIGS